MLRLKFWMQMNNIIEIRAEVDDIIEIVVHIIIISKYMLIAIA